MGYKHNCAAYNIKHGKLKDRKGNLESELASLESQLDSLTNQKAGYEQSEGKAASDWRIRGFNNKIDKLYDRIDNKISKIKCYEEKISDLELSVDYCDVCSPELYDRDE